METQIMRVLLLTACLFAAGPVLAQSEAPSGQTAAQPPTAVAIPQLRAEANKAYVGKDFARFRDIVAQLHGLFPYNQQYMTQLVYAHALNGDRKNAYDMMLTMQRQGLAHDFNASDDSKNIRGTEAYDYINDLMVRAGEPNGAADLRFPLPAEVVLPTALVWDPSREAFLVGDASQGGLWQVERSGETRRLAFADEDTGLWSIFGLLVDAENNRLWVSSSASRIHAEIDPAEAGRAGLFEFTLDELKLLKKYPVAADGLPHRLGEVVKLGDDLYSVDAYRPVVYRLNAGEDRVRPFIALTQSVLLRGLVADEKRQLLYVSDAERGVQIIDLNGQRALGLAVPETLNMAGIESLALADNALVMVQSGIAPQRIMRLNLDATGAAVEGVVPLAIAMDFFDGPNASVLVDDELFFMANQQPVRAKIARRPVRIGSAKIDDDQELSAPDMDKFWDDYYEKTGKERPPQNGG